MNSKFVLFSISVAILTVTVTVVSGTIGLQAYATLHPDRANLLRQQKQRPYCHNG